MREIFFSQEVPWQSLPASRRDSVYHTLHPSIHWVGMVAANTEVNCSCYDCLWSVFTHVAISHANLLEHKKVFP